MAEAGEAQTASAWHAQMLNQGFQRFSRRMALHASSEKQVKKPQSRKQTETVLKEGKEAVNYGSASETEGTGYRKAMMALPPDAHADTLCICRSLCQDRCSNHKRSMLDLP